MLAVRKNLTEILLEVTNEEIIDIVKESVAKNRKKGSECAFIVYKIIKTNKSPIRVFFYIKIGFPLHFYDYFLSSLVFKPKKKNLIPFFSFQKIIIFKINCKIYKAPTAQVRKSALSSITGGLGELIFLMIYIFIFSQIPLEAP